MNNDNIAQTIPVITPQIVALVRQRGASKLLDSITEWMMKIHHPHSGKIIESVVQILPDDEFDVLAALCLGYEDDELVQQFSASVVVRLASKQGMKTIEYEKYLNASKNFLLLVTTEARRRTGEVTYSFPNDIFRDLSHVLFIHLTPEGRSKMALEILEHYETTKKQ